MHLLTLRTLHRTTYMTAMAAVMLAIGASAHHDRSRYYEVSDNTRLDRTDPVCAAQELDIEVKCSAATIWTEIGASALRLTCDETDNGLDYRDTRDTDFMWRVDWACEADPPGADSAEDVNRYISHVEITGTLECVYATPRLGAQANCEYDLHD